MMRKLTMPKAVAGDVHTPWFDFDRAACGVSRGAAGIAIRHGHDEPVSVRLTGKPATAMDS